MNVLNVPKAYEKNDQFLNDAEFEDEKCYFEDEMKINSLVTFNMLVWTKR